MKVIEVRPDLEANWDQIANDEKVGSFMQSLLWGEFKKALGQKVWNLAVVDDKYSGKNPAVEPAGTLRGEILAISQVVKEELVGFGHFLYVPYGPIFKTDNKEEVLNVLLEKLKILAKEEKAIFVRLEPKIALSNRGLKFYNTYRQIQHTLKMSLELSEEELLASLKQKTRYNLRLSQKKGVKIVEGRKEDLAEFILMLKSVGKRGDFYLPRKEYFYQMFDTLKSKNTVYLLIDKYRGKIIGGFINIYFMDEATYLYGASRDEYRNLMANYPLMWETISRAKNHDCKRLDFRGASPNEDDQAHPWYGFTRFKRGFAPYSPVESYPGSYFLIANTLKFYLYYAQKLIRRRPL